MAPLSNEYFLTIQGVAPIRYDNSRLCSSSCRMRALKMETNTMDAFMKHVCNAFLRLSHNLQYPSDRRVLSETIAYKKDRPPSVPT